MIAYRVGLIAALLISLHMPAWADDNQPLFIAITELPNNNYTVHLQAPPKLTLANIPVIKLPRDCSNANKQRATMIPVSRTQRILYHCQTRLLGDTITIAYPNYNPAFSSLIKWVALSGEKHTALLSPSQSHWQVPQAETASQVAKDYLQFGLFHIWEGSDHLLFLVCLIWLAGTWSRILITVTGFTLAHSITLVLSALKVIQLPIVPVEAVIALSIVFLAVEITKARRDTLAWRYPVAVSSSFGLLHGLGFAAVLSDIGLPQTEVVTGLLFFNIGVEIGQVVFVVAVGLVLTVFRYCFVRLKPEWLSDILAARVAGYTVGIMSSYWLVERCAGFVPFL